MAAKVLVVDDDTSVSYIVAETLRDEAFTVAVANNGLEALHLLEDGLEPDALVLDLAMPVMDGRELFHEIRQRGWDVPVLVLSAVGARQAMRELGAEAAMEKPFDLDRLVARVRTLTDHN
jgi:DNA-binding response OmpR family regulator